MAVRLIASLARKAAGETGDPRAYIRQALMVLDLSHADPGFDPDPGTVVFHDTPPSLSFSLQSSVKPTAQPTETTYVIQPGDTLSQIAVRYGVPLDAILRSNHIPNPDSIQAGQAIVIPPPTD